MNSKVLILGVLTLVAIGGGAYYLSHSNSAQTDAEAMHANPETKEFTLKMEGKKLVQGQSVLSVHAGDMVVLHLTNDENEEFHVHGYDRSVDMEAGKQAELRFVADTAGRFPAELEGSKTDILVLEVLPR